MRLVGTSFTVSVFFMLPNTQSESFCGVAESLTIDLGSKRVDAVIESALHGPRVDLRFGGEP